MALTNDERARRYQEAFDEFIQERKLDVEYTESWSAEDNAAWERVAARLRSEGVLH